MKTAIRFVRENKELQHVCETLKQEPCPHCGRTGTLNRHDTIHGNDPYATGKQTVRGRRAWCSNRGRRGGCGRTCAILFAWVLPRHTFTAPLLDRLLKGLRRGASVSGICRETTMPFPLESVYHLLQRLRRMLDRLRTTLCARCKPPASRHADPLRQTAEHLRAAFPGACGAAAAFQHALQKPLLG